MNKNVTAIEISPSGIRIVTGYCFNKNVYVRQALQGVPLSLDDNGQIDVDDAASSLAIQLNNLKKTLNEDLGLVVPIFPAHSITITKSDGTTYVSGELITQTD